jgi:hypothetical protein
LVAKGWEEGEMGSYCLMGKEFQFFKMKRVAETDGWTTFLLYLIPLNYIFKNSQDGNVSGLNLQYQKEKVTNIVCILPQFKKIEKKMDILYTPVIPAPALRKWKQEFIVLAMSYIARP